MFHTGIREFANGSEAGNGVYGMDIEVGLSMKEPANHQCKVHHLVIKRGDFLFINVTNTQPVYIVNALPIVIGKGNLHTNFYGAHCDAKNFREPRQERRNRGY